MVSEQTQNALTELQQKLAVTEEALERAEKLAIAGRFAAVAIHEINNPLEAVSNLVYLMQGQEMSPDAATYLQMMEEQLLRVSTITRQTLSFNRTAHRRQRADLVELIDIATRTFSRNILDKRINMQFDLPKVAHCDVYPGELTQALSNLISNAIDASEPGGKIRLRIRLSSGWYSITVCDSGCGIPESLRKTLFEAFATGKELGNGLGLWVFRRIIEKHGGRVRWRSTTHPEKHGTAFRISLQHMQTESQRVH